MAAFIEPKCKNCYDKGYSTQWWGLHGSPDFIGDKGFDEPARVHKKFCTCAKGKRLRRQDVKQHNS